MYNYIHISDKEIPGWQMKGVIKIVALPSATNGSWILEEIRLSFSETA